MISTWVSISDSEIYKTSPGEIRGFLLGNTFFSQHLKHLFYTLLPIPVLADPSAQALFRTN